MMTANESDNALVAAGLMKRYGPVPALAGVDLAVARAQTLAVMGPSGCGKSTLLHVLAGILVPDEGTVDFAGRSLTALSEAARSALRLSDFGFVFQDGQLLPELTNEENVALPLMMSGASKGEAVRRAHEWLGRFGLAGMESRRPGELSGGQAQRVAIARALVHGPSVVFADEPTGALDQATGREVMQILADASSQNGASLVMVTHDPSVAAWCQRTVTMSDGRIIADSAAGPTTPSAPAPGLAGYSTTDLSAMSAPVIGQTRPATMPPTTTQTPAAAPGATVAPTSWSFSGSFLPAENHRIAGVQPFAESRSVTGPANSRRTGSSRTEEALG